MIDPDILAQVRRIRIRTQRMVTDVMSGGYTSVFRGSGIEFDEVREYMEGDDIRSIDWNVTARTGRHHIKKFMEERQLTVLFVLDVSGSTSFGTQRRTDGAVRSVRDLSALFCACLALAAQRNNDMAGLIAFSDRIERYVPAKKGSQHVMRLVRDILAAPGEGRGTDLGAALDYAARVQRKRAVVFVVSDFLADDFDKPLRRLARRHDVIAVKMRDPATQELPAAGLLRVRDAETGQDGFVDTGSRAVREAYKAQVAAADARLEQTLRRAGVDQMRIESEAGMSAEILRFFRMRELRGSHG